MRTRLTYPSRSHGGLGPDISPDPRGETNPAAPGRISRPRGAWTEGEKGLGRRAKADKGRGRGRGASGGRGVGAAASGQARRAAGRCSGVGGGRRRVCGDEIDWVDPAQDKVWVGSIRLSNRGIIVFSTYATGPHNYASVKSN